jgi:hypothetical protein
MSMSAWSQVAGGSGDASFSVGYDHVGKGPNNDFSDNSGNSVTTGGNGGYNIDRFIEAGGEFSFFNDPQPSISGVNVGLKILDYGGLVRFNLAPASKVVPYGVFGIGGSRATAHASLGSSSASISENGYYLGFGGGASVYLRPSWGIRAEFRDNWNHFTYQGSKNSTDALAMTCGLFYQFGGPGRTGR